MADVEMEEAPPDVSLTGFWQLLDADTDLRKHLLTEGTIFRWPSKKVVGITTFDTVGCNVEVLKSLLSIWLPQMKEAKTIYIEHAKVEA